MKRCPVCEIKFEDDKVQCPYDQTALVVVSVLSTDMLIGVTIDGKYRLERRIGRGGMGSVYIARHTQFDKKVAVKVLSPETMEDPTSYDRFKQEAEASARIKHPNVVPVTDFGQTPDGIIYLVMEYIEGQSLRTLLDREVRMLPDRAVEIGRQVCAAVAAAHRAGIIHRDLKPDNVMIEVIDGNEVARVFDFGIAKLKDQKKRLTETGSVMGTPQYMSPEQCLGNPVDHRSDIYALGVMLYEMLSGQLPFDGENAASVIVAQATKEPTPLDEMCDDLPAPLVRVVMNALAKKPNERQQSATDLGVQLQTALEIAANAKSAAVSSGKISEKLPTLKMGNPEVTVDPLLVTNELDQLVFVTEQNKKKTGAISTGPLVEPNATSQFAVSETLTNQVEKGATQSMAAAMATEMSASMTSGWTVEIDGTIFEAIPEEEVKAWIRTSKLGPTHKIRVGDDWQNVANIPQFRELLPEQHSHAGSQYASPPLAAQSFGKLNVQTVETEAEPAGKLFMQRMAKLSAAVVVLYVVFNLGSQFIQHRKLQANLRDAMEATKGNLPNLKGRIKSALMDSNENPTEFDIKITAEPAVRRVVAELNYQRKLFFIPMRKSLTHAVAGFELPMHHLAALPDGEAEIVGVSVAEIEKFRREQRAKQQAAKAVANIKDYKGEPETLKDMDDLIAELAECERSLPLFDVSLQDQEGRTIVNKTIKIRDKEFTKESLVTYIAELKTRKSNLETLLAEQRKRKRLEVENQALKSVTQ